MNGLVLDIDRFSTHEGPGIRMTIFLKGCPLRCEWCHSPESQIGVQQLLYQRSRCRDCLSCVSACLQHVLIPNLEISEEEGNKGIHIDRERCISCFSCVRACKSKALKIGGWYCTTEEIEEIILKDKPFYHNSGGGVTVSGGEPLAQAEFTMEILKFCKGLNVHTALETCGFVDYEILKEAFGYADLLFYDIKLMDNKLRGKYTGRDNIMILDNLAKLSRENSGFEKIIVRVPCIPDRNDSPEQIRETARYVYSLGLRRIQLLPYNTMAGEKYEWIGIPFSLKELQTRDLSYYENLNLILCDEGIKPVKINKEK